MPNVMTVLKDEILRLARKEVKGAAEPLRAGAVSTRKALSDLTKRVAALEKEFRRLSASAPVAPESAGAGAVADDGAEESKARITAKGVRSLRRRLGFTRKEFAALVGVSEQNVYLWERKDGPLRVRDATRDALLSVRDIGSREARVRIASTQG